MDDLLLCDDEFVGFAYKEDGTIKYRERVDYKNLFVPSCDCKAYCQREWANNCFNVDQDKLGSSIVVMMESPHVDEFFDEPLNCYRNGVVYSRPAAGSTGRKFNQFITDILYNISRYTPIDLDYVPDFLTILDDGLIHPVVKMNACQFQCSLGLSPLNKRIRDQVFLSCLWDDDARLNYVSMIARVSTINPSLLIVACTKGEESNVSDWYSAHTECEIDADFVGSLRGTVQYFLNRTGVEYVCVEHPFRWFTSREVLSVHTV